MFTNANTKPATTEPDPIRTWRVTSYQAPTADISAHEHEVTAEGDVIFTTYEPDGEIVSCSWARGGWLSVALVADAKPSDG